MQMPSVSLTIVSMGLPSDNPPKLPAAKVLQGVERAPGKLRSQISENIGASFERLRTPARSTLAALVGFWPLLLIVGMGVALLWSASVANGP